MKKWMLPLAVTVLVSSSITTIPSVSANSLNEMKEEKKNIEIKKNELNDGIQKKSEEIDVNKTKIKEIEEKIKKIDKEVEEANNEIARVERDIVIITEEIEALQASIQDLENKIKDREVVIQERMRAMQVNGDSVNYLDVLLGANSFSDFIDRVSTVSTILEADKAIMQQQADDQAKLESDKVLVEEKLAELEENKKELDKLKESLESKRQEQDKLVAQLKVEQGKLSNEKDKLEIEFEEAYEVSKELEREIANEEAAIAELARQAEIAQKELEEQQRRDAEAAAAAAEATPNVQNEAVVSQGAGKSATPQASAQVPSGSANKPADSTAKSPATKPSVTTPPPAVSSGGGWVRPTTGRMTSQFGYRTGFGAGNHRGTDIANSSGTPIYAAGNGVVQRTGTLGTYGNIVMIKHSVNGKVYTTLYAHLSAASVSPGQVVSAGQVIGSMGNTGNSSGPHLHFEFHIGAWTGYGPSAVNPRSYVPF